MSMDNDIFLFSNSEYRDNDGEVLVRRRFISSLKHAEMPFVIRFKSGVYGEALDPVALCDFLFDWDFSNKPVEHWKMLLTASLRRIAFEYAVEGKRVILYDERGYHFDNVLDHDENHPFPLDGIVFTNFDTPYIIDGFDPCTAIASLIRIGYIQYYEKYPLFSEKKKVPGIGKCSFHRKLKNHEIDTCYAWHCDGESMEKKWKGNCFWLTNGGEFDVYKKVEPHEVITDFSHKQGWMPIEERIKLFQSWKER